MLWGGVFGSSPGGHIRLWQGSFARISCNNWREVMREDTINVGGQGLEYCILPCNQPNGSGSWAGRELDVAPARIIGSRPCTTLRIMGDLSINNYLAITVCGWLLRSVANHCQCYDGGIYWSTGRWTCDLSEHAILRHTPLCNQMLHGHESLVFT